VFLLIHLPINMPDKKKIKLGGATINLIAFAGSFVLLFAYYSVRNNISQNRIVENGTITTVQSGSDFSSGNDQYYFKTPDNKSIMLYNSPKQDVYYHKTGDPLMYENSNPENYIYLPVSAKEPFIEAFISAMIMSLAFTFFVWWLRRLIQFIKKFKEVGFIGMLK